MSNSEELPLYYDHYQTEDLEKIIDTQSKVVDYLKKKNSKKYFKY